MRLVVDVLLRAESYLNPLGDRELYLRGFKIPAIENLAVLQDQHDAIDFSDNDIRKLDNFPQMKRLTMLLLANNNVARVGISLEEYIPHLKHLILTNNKIASFLEIDHLSSLKELEHLSLMENPVSYTPHYRLFTIYRVSSLKSLDYQKVTVTERAEANKFFTESPVGIDIISRINEERASEQSSNTMNHSHSNNINSSGYLSSMAAASSLPPKPAVMVLTDSQKQEIREAITNAVTKDEVDRIEQQLRTGTFQFQSTSLPSSEARGTKRERSDDDDEVADKKRTGPVGVLVT